MHCPRCHHLTPPTAKFCEHCAAPLPVAPTPTQYITDARGAQGVAIGDGARVVFAPESAPSSTPPTVTAQRLADTFPTAYAHQLKASDFPFVTVTVDNTAPGCAATTVRVSAENIEITKPSRPRRMP